MSKHSRGGQTTPSWPSTSPDDAGNPPSGKHHVAAQDDPTDAAFNPFAGLVGGHSAARSTSATQVVDDADNPLLAMFGAPAENPTVTGDVPVDRDNSTTDPGSSRPQDDPTSEAFNPFAGLVGGHSAPASTTDTPADDTDNPLLDMFGATPPTHTASTDEPTPSDTQGDNAFDAMWMPLDTEPPADAEDHTGTGDPPSVNPTAAQDDPTSEAFNPFAGLVGGHSAPASTTDTPADDTDNPLLDMFGATPQTETSTDEQAPRNDPGDNAFDAMWMPLDTEPTSDSTERGETDGGSGDVPAFDAMWMPLDSLPAEDTAAEPAGPPDEGPEASDVDTTVAHVDADPEVSTVSEDSDDDESTAEDDEFDDIEARAAQLLARLGGAPEAPADAVDDHPEFVIPTMSDESVSDGSPEPFGDTDDSDEWAADDLGGGLLDLDDDSADIDADAPDSHPDFVIPTMSDEPASDELVESATPTPDHDDALPSPAPAPDGDDGASAYTAPIPEPTTPPEVPPTPGDSIATDAAPEPGDADAVPSPPPVSDATQVIATSEPSRDDRTMVVRKPPPPPPSRPRRRRPARPPWQQGAADATPADEKAAPQDPQPQNVSRATPPAPSAPPAPPVRPTQAPGPAGRPAPSSPQVQGAPPRPATPQAGPRPPQPVPSPQPLRPRPAPRHQSPAAGRPGAAPTAGRQPSHAAPPAPSGPDTPKVSPPAPPRPAPPRGQVPPSAAPGAPAAPPRGPRPPHTPPAVAPQAAQPFSPPAPARGPAGRPPVPPPPAAPPPHLTHRPPRSAPPGSPPAQRTAPPVGQRPPSPPTGPRPPDAPATSPVQRLANPVRPAHAPSVDDARRTDRRDNAPQGGWRRAVHTASAGRLNPGDSRAAQQQQELAARLRQPIPGDFRIAILSMKGGVGKTTTTVGLGSAFSSARGDRVIAVDANPDRGTLADRVPRTTQATVRDLLDLGEVKHYADVSNLTSTAPSRLEVLASEQDPAAADAYDEADYRQTMDHLSQFYNIILTDCGTGIMHSAMGGILDLADAVVLVTTPAPDAARSASATLDWLNLHGYGRLATEAHVVLSSSRSSSPPQVDVDKVVEHFSSRCRSLHYIPFDQHLAEGGVIDLTQLNSNTRQAYQELAGAVLDNFRARNQGPSSDIDGRKHEPEHT